LFEAAARLGSFKPAAEGLNLTQAAIGPRIRALGTDREKGGSRSCAAIAQRR